MAKAKDTEASTAYKVSVLDDEFEESVDEFEESVGEIDSSVDEIDDAVDEIDESVDNIVGSTLVWVNGGTVGIVTTSTPARIIPVITPFVKAAAISSLASVSLLIASRTILLSRYSAVIM